MVLVLHAVSGFHRTPPCASLFNGVPCLWQPHHVVVTPRVDMGIVGLHYAVCKVTDAILTSAGPSTTRELAFLPPPLAKAAAKQVSVLSGSMLAIVAQLCWLMPCLAAKLQQTLPSQGRRVLLRCLYLVEQLSG